MPILDPTYAALKERKFIVDILEKEGFKFQQVPRGYLYHRAGYCSFIPEAVIEWMSQWMMTGKDILKIIVDERHKHGTHLPNPKESLETAKEDDIGN